MSAFDQIPNTVIGLPSTLQGNLDYKLAQGVTSSSVRVLPTSNASVVTTVALTPSLAAHPDIPQTQTQILFDIPCSGNPGQFIDTRMTTLNFRATFTCPTAGSAAITTGFLRSNCMSFFDRSETKNSGQTVDIMEEVGLVHDSLIAGQFSPSDLDGNSLLYGFLSGTANERQGLAIKMLTANTLLTSQVETHSFSVPLMNPVFGVTASKMCNTGRLSNLQYILSTSNILPLSIATGLTPGSLTVTLTDFSIGLEIINIPQEILYMVDNTLSNGKFYNSGIAYRTGSTNLASTTGTSSLLCPSVKGSSVKSIFARFVDGGTASVNNSVNGKYDSKNPSINSYSFNIGSVYYPNYKVNPLLSPSSSLLEFYKGMGSFNNSQLKSSCIPAQYCKASAGVTVTTLVSGNTCDENYSNGAAADKLCSFIIGQNTEIVARQSLVSGINVQASNVFLEINLSSAPTNAHTVYITSMNDVIFEHDINTKLIRAIM